MPEISVCNKMAWNWPFFKEKNILISILKYKDKTPPHSLYMLCMCHKIFMQMRDYLAKGLSLFEMEWLNSNICFIRAKRNLLMLFSQHVSFTRSLKLAVRKFALRSLTFAPVTSASWDLYLETLNFLTLTVMVNQLKLQGPSNPKTKPTRNHHHLNLSYRKLLSALIFMQEPFSPSLSSSSMLSTGQSICKRKKKKVICILGTERTVLTLKVHFILSIFSKVHGCLKFYL